MMADEEDVDPEQAAAMKGMMQGVVADMGYLSTELKPQPEDPDAHITFGKVVGALAGCPSLADVGAECSTESITSIASALSDVVDAAALDYKEPVRTNALLIYWQLNRERPGLKDAAELGEETSRQASTALQKCVKLLIQAQMLMPQQRWMQQTLAVARASALVANSLWSHSEEAAVKAMTHILEGDGLRSPQLELSAFASPKDAPDLSEEGCAVLPKTLVEISVVVERKHWGGAEDAKVTNNQGIFEAYWLYIEGQKPKGTQNSMIAAQPMVVKDVDMKTVEAKVVFQAPPTPGKFRLTVHTLSTSVIGIELSQDVEFEVLEDDVPELA